MSDRDLVVARALSRLPIPDHAPGFWDRLDATLAAEPDVDVPPTSATAVAVAPEPSPEPSTSPEPALVPSFELAAEPQPEPALEPAAPSEPVLHPEPVPVTELRPERERRRHRNRRVLAVAAVSVAVIAGASWAISATDQTGDGAPPAAAPTSGSGTATTVPAPMASGPTPTAPTATAPALPTTTATTAPLSADGQAAQDAVQQFVAELGRGDIDAAAQRIGPRSEAYVASQQADDPNAVHDMLATSASEGFGAFARATDATHTTIPLRGDEYVVVVRGTVTQEGTTAYRSYAFPVRFSASIPGAAFIEPWAFDPANGSRAEFSGIGANGQVEGATVPAGSTVTAHVPSPGTVWFGLLGSDLLAVPTTTSGPGASASWTFPTGPTGPQTFVAVYETPDGFIAASAFQLTVAG